MNAESSSTLKLSTVCRSSLSLFEASISHAIEVATNSRFDWSFKRGASAYATQYTELSTGTTKKLTKGLPVMRLIISEYKSILPWLRIPQSRQFSLASVPPPPTGAKVFPLARRSEVP